MMEKSLKGKFIKISNEAEFTPKMCKQEKGDQGLFWHKNQFENQEKILKPGMSIEVDLPKKRANMTMTFQIRANDITKNFKASTGFKGGVVASKWRSIAWVNGPSGAGKPHI